MEAKKILFWGIGWPKSIDVSESEKCQFLVNSTCPIKANEVVTHKIFRNIDCDKKTGSVELTDEVRNERGQVLVCFKLSIEILDNNSCYNY